MTWGAIQDVLSTMHRFSPVLVKCPSCRSLAQNEALSCGSVRNEQPESHSKRYNPSEEDHGNGDSEHCSNHVRIQAAIW